MTLFLWIAVGLVLLWVVVRFVFKVLGCFVHLLLLAAAVAILYSFFS
jgi:Family of unknown function (DUF5670)